MNGLPYYKAYPRDFLEGTIGMSFEEKGAYRLVLDLIYMQGGSLPDDARYISGHLGCTVRKWNMLRTRLISLGKIVTENGVISNYRADKEIEILRKLQEKQRENASGPRKNKGLEKPRLSHTEPEPDIEPNGSIERAHSRRSPEKKATRLPPDWIIPEAFIAFAESEGMTAQEIGREADQFRDYWVAKSGKDACKRDWLATWRRWVRNRKAFAPRSAPANAHLANTERRRNGWREAIDAADGGIGEGADGPSEPDGGDGGEGHYPRLAYASEATGGSFGY